MESGTTKLLFDFGAVLFVSLLLGSIFEHLGLSSVIGYLLSGYLLGPQGLGLVTDSDLISLFSTMGIILLLFFTGLKMDPKRFMEAGAYAIILSPLKSGAVFLLGFLIGKAMGFSTLEAFIIGAGLAGSSTAIISHAILKRGWERRHEARIALSMLVLEDLLSVFFIAYLMGMMNVTVPVPKVLLHTFALAFIVFSLGTFIIIRLFKILSPFIDETNWPLYVLGLITLFAYGVSLLGISPVIGAFFAGLALATTRLAEPLYRKMAEYKNLFALFFFTSLGLKYVISFSSTALLLGILFSLAVWIQVFVVLLIGPLLGLEPERALKLGILMLPIGEFSLFFSAVAQDLGLPHGDVIMGGFFIGMVITTALGGWLINREERVVSFVKRIFPGLFAKRAVIRFFPLPKGETVSLPKKRNRFLAYFLSSFILYYFAGYLATNHLVGLIGFTVFYVLASIFLSLSLVELKHHVERELGILMGGEDRESRLVVSVIFSLLILLAGAFLYVVSDALSVVSLFLMSVYLLFLGIAILAVNLLRSVFS